MIARIIVIMILWTGLQGRQINEEVNSMLLSSPWKLEILKTPTQPNVPPDLQGRQFEVNIPTVLHLDLLRNKVIEDPFFRDNHKQMLWISKCQVRYSIQFLIEQSNLTDKAVQLVFYGIDTYAEVRLNGELIQKTQNAFRKYVIRVQDRVKLNKTINKLQVQIFPAEAHDEQEQMKNKMTSLFAQTRKPCYQYSWDWAPKLITMGIWKEVELRIFKEIRIDYTWVRNKQISEQQATLNFASQLQLNTFKDEPLSEGYKYVIELEGDEISKTSITEDTVYLDVVIESPRLWWPNGIGESYVYEFYVRIYKDDQVIEEQFIIFGIRTVQLDLKEKQFRVIVNGYPVYCKGANYVPTDMFYPRGNERSEDLIAEAVQSNFNMIRIWGGGQYESDKFLDLASRFGIMIFYDFMFSDSTYPSTQPFLVNVEEEIKQLIRKTRNFPALTIWCGNNQILQGIQSWGWATPKYKEDYKKLFEILIPKIVQKQSPDIPYIPSSPIYGVGNSGFQKGGDFHYWGVWATGNDFDSYRKVVGPFNSQFGTQSLPVWHSIKEFTLKQDRSYDSRVFLSHQKHSSRFSRLKLYMGNHMQPSINFQMETYQSGILQAYAIEIAITAQRIAKPKCYGTLYWQFNDAWPAISWSSIDYYGRWKPLQYTAKKLYNNIAVFITELDEVIAVNDNLYEVSVQVSFGLMKFNGSILNADTLKIKLDADSTKLVTKIKKPQNFKSSDCVAYATIKQDQKLIMINTKYYERYKDLQLPQATLSVTYSNQITVSSNKLIKNLFIDHEDQYLKLSDNYFDVLPGHPVSITVNTSKINFQEIKNKLKFTSLRQSYKNQILTIKITE